MWFVAEKIGFQFSFGILVPAPASMRIEGEIFNEYLLGSRVQYQVRARGMTLLVERIRDDADEPAQSVALSFAPEDSMLFAE